MLSVGENCFDLSTTAGEMVGNVGHTRFRYIYQLFAYLLLKTNHCCRHDYMVLSMILRCDGDMFNCILLTNEIRIFRNFEHSRTLFLSHSL